MPPDKIPSLAINNGESVFVSAGSLSHHSYVIWEERRLESNIHSFLLALYSASDYGGSILLTQLTGLTGGPPPGTWFLTTM